MFKWFSNDKQPTYTVPHWLCFTIERLGLTLILELLEKHKTIDECIKFNGKLLEEFEISRDELELVDSAEAFRRRLLARNPIHM